MRRANIQRAVKVTKGGGRLRVWAMLFTDVLVLGGAFFLSFFARTLFLQDIFERRIQGIGTYYLPGGVVICLCLVSLAFSRLYEDRRYLARLEEYAAIVKAVVYAMLAAMGLTFFFKAHDYSRGLLALFWILGTVLLVLERHLWHRFIKRRRARGGDSVRVAVVAVPGGGKRIAAMLERFPELGYVPVAWLTMTSHSVASNLKRLTMLVRSGRAGSVVVGVPTSKFHLAVPYLSWCEENYVPHHRITGAFDALYGDARSSGNLLAVERKPLYAFLKRVMDEVIALCAVIVSAPLWLVIAVLIKLESPGPILFVQDRVGRHGRLFRLLKFRTMYAHSPRYALTARSRQDPRVTSMGRFLRRTSLDELPQLLNVLKGEMSIVGPRPEMDFMMKKNTSEYARRLQVLPGMTGLWQAVARNEPLEESLRYDLYYIQHQSFIFDLIIMARTVLTVFTGKGAV